VAELSRKQPSQRIWRGELWIRKSLRNQRRHRRKERARLEPKGSPASGFGEGRRIRYSFREGIQIG